MQANDSAPFRETLAGVYAFWGKELTPYMLDVWWMALRMFDLAAVRDALGRHIVNPDTGKFLPRPADVVRMLQGSTQDSAQVAWSKVDRAVRHVGTQMTVVFDDPLIHRALYDMGGWDQLGKKTEDEWPFIAKDFINRYRGYRERSETPDYLPVMVGSFEAANNQRGYRSDPPVLVGNVEQARRVMQGGAKTPLLTFTPASPADFEPLLIEQKRVAA